MVSLHRVGGGDSVATLADIGYEEGADSHTTQNHLGFSPPTTPTANTPLKAGGAVSLTERRMLEHYAVLLHDIRVAATQVATSDYHRFYASAVEELLTASASRGGRGAVSVPRSVVWQDAAAPKDSGKGGEDATAQAERRLAAWASSWYTELKQWHARHSTHGPGTSNVFDAQQSLLNGELGQDVLVGREDVVGTREEDKSMAALLLQGQWQVAIDSLLAGDATQPPFASAAPIEPHSTFSTVPQQLSVAELFSTASVLHRHRVPWRPSPQRGSANSSSSTLPPLPRRLALAPVTLTELRLLQYPPSPGLRVLSHLTASEEQCGECQAMSAGNRVKVAPSQLLEAAAAAEVAAGRATGTPPTCVVRLRRRLWVLQHLPRHLPASLVRFQEPRRPSKRAGGGSCCKGPNRTMPRAYLLRSHALEKLPWYTLCVLGEVLEVGGKDNLTVATVLRNARTHTCAALFLNVPADYAALHDYVHTLFLTLGSSMVARAVATQQKQQGRSDSDKAVSVFEGAFAQTAIALLQPPPPEAYAAAGLSARPISASGNATSLLARSSSAQARSPSTDITDVHVVSPQVFCHLCAAVQDWRNYHLSLYCETLSQIADSDGVALRELARVLEVQPHSEEELQEKAAVVLAPESAAAVVTALLLQRLGQVSRPSASSLSTTDRAPLPSLPDTPRTIAPHPSVGCHPQATSPSPPPLPQVLYFIAPHDKAHAVANYFKGIFHRSFFKRVVTAAAAAAAKEEAVVGAAVTPGLKKDPRQPRDYAAPISATPTTTATSPRTAEEGNGSASAPPALVLPPAEWDRNAAARLVGRTLRRLDRYPTRTTEAFFARYVRGDDVDPKREGEEAASVAVAAATQSASTTVAPPLAMNLFVVSLQAAVDYWHDRHCRPVLDVPPAASCSPQQKGEQATFTAQSAATVPAVDSPTSALVGTAAAATPATVEASLSKDDKDGLPDAIVLLASPPILPHGLHAVYKPAGVNCTLHAHYPSLVYPFLTCELPWRAGGVVTADGNDEHRDAGASSSSLPPSSPPSCVPVLRQQGLVNRIDVGTSGVVLVARNAAALHGATDTMIREHHIRKTYRALVQRWPPFSSSSSASTVPYSNDSAEVAPLFSVSPFLSPMASTVVCAPVYAAGATAASIRWRPALSLSHDCQLQLSARHSADTLSVSGAASTLSQSSSIPSSPCSLAHVHQQYATLHAALQDQRNAITCYRVLEYFASTGVAYVQVELRSGRRHQIRQHFAQLGFPLVGDARYHAGVAAGHSGTTFGMQRAALHAYAVNILATTSGDGQASDEEGPNRVVVQAALPADMHHALLALRKAEQGKSRRQRQQQQPQQHRG
ncbi:putative RNA pseudouridylate synthase [Leishmania shawi]|uniref:RNA pseudouridylate synthase n=1 Tax=Leishmania shawi TaxID=5680 RepID=A0AAW3CBB7_9TRYP